MKMRTIIPATSANLGPAFDCLGVALELRNTFEFETCPSGLDIQITGEGMGTLSSGEDNLVYEIFKAELERLNVAKPSGVRLRIDNQVPVGSGMGSSSTATLAGVIFAFAYARYVRGMDPAGVDLPDVLARAIELEGHGDNVAPALEGGLQLVVAEGEKHSVHNLNCVLWNVVVAVPDYNFPTSLARQALPANYPKADTLYNIAHSFLLAEALSKGDMDLLATAIGDKIHQPYRLPKIPGAQEAFNAAYSAGAKAVCLSGAGPGVIAFSRNKFDEIGTSMVTAFESAGLSARYWVLETTGHGLTIENLA